MARPQSKITAQGQISVPAEIRRRLGIGPGAVLEWVEAGEHVVVRRVGRYSWEDVHRVLFTETPTPKTPDEVKDGIRRHVRRRHAGR